MPVSQVCVSWLVHLGHTLANRFALLVFTVPQDWEVWLIALVLLPPCVPAWVRATEASSAIFRNIKDWMLWIRTLLSRAQLLKNVRRIIACNRTALARQRAIFFIEHVQEGKLLILALMPVALMVPAWMAPTDAVAILILDQWEVGILTELLPAKACHMQRVCRHHVRQRCRNQQCCHQAQRSVCRHGQSLHSFKGSRRSQSESQE
mmetsp:Transcript_68773/g.128316  ORF Transcript_68773/g.128316 Transcript_68773/m.128316 type:complete len:206 (+) Transcript_68773:75-692(+)